MATTRDRARQALSRELEESHIAYGHATQIDCWHYLHGPHRDFGGNRINLGKYGNDEFGWYENEGFDNAFREFWEDKDKDRQRTDEQNSLHFKLRREGENLPTVFRTRLDFYIELIAMVARRVFVRLMEIAGEGDPIAWATEQAQQLVRANRHLVITGVRMACDRDDSDPESWLAPVFLTMKPAGPDPHDIERVWNRREWARMDEADTRDVLNYFADEFVRSLEDCIDAAAGAAYEEAAKLEAAKRREPKVTEASVSAQPVAAPEGNASSQVEDDEAKYQTQQEAVRYVRNQPAGSWINRRMTIKATGLKWDTIRRKKGIKRNEKGQSLRESILRYVDQKRTKRKPNRRRK